MYSDAGWGLMRISSDGKRQTFLSLADGVSANVQGMVVTEDGVWIASYSTGLL